MKIYKCFPQGKFKVLTMSYDDGNKADVRLVSIFNKYRIRGSFNLNYGLMEQDDKVDIQQVKDLYEGHEVSTHTYTHPTIARCPGVMIAQEIMEDRKGWEQLLGYPVRGHAYPNGSYSKEVIDIFRSLGIAYGRVVEETQKFELPTNSMIWQPTCHHCHNLMTLAKKFVDFQQSQYLKCMYVWGHSYEFDRDNNWELIEEFCEYMGGREDIWYATNIEIIDYMKLCDNLQFAADGSFVYNPGAKSVWISVDGVVKEIEGGKLVTLK